MIGGLHVPDWGQYLMGLVFGLLVICAVVFPWKDGWKSFYQWVWEHLIACWLQSPVGNCAYTIKIIADSLAPCRKRLTTWELTYPRMVHAELMTHRMFSRNAASSRAIPVWKMILQVVKAPAHPVWWGANQSGMQAKAELTGLRRWLAQQCWYQGRWLAVGLAWVMWKVGLHKQLVNRVLEPWCWITVILSATEYGNWFHLRSHPDAQPEIKYVADKMNIVYHLSRPRPLAAGEWHLPYIGFEGDEHLTEEEAVKVCVGRCARVSYLTHDGKRDVGADIGLHDRLQSGSGDVGHWSPYEHAAQALPTPEPSGNYVGWRQYRKMFEREHHADYEFRTEVLLTI